MYVGRLSFAVSSGRWLIEAFVRILRARAAAVTTTGQAAYSVVKETHAQCL